MRTCPSWCTQHPALEPEVHQGFVVVPGATDGVQIEARNDEDPVLSIEVTTMNEADARELGMALVSAAERLRREIDR